jgi:glycerophosphoryl diester phosphodiesterase
VVISALVAPCSGLDLTGHRGGFSDEKSFVPEHSPAAYALGARIGVSFLEPDVISTKDGVLMVMHGNELSGTSDVAEKFPGRNTTKTISNKQQSGYFSEDFTWDEIKTLRLRARAYNGTGPLDGIYPFFKFSEMLEYVKYLAEATSSYGNLGVYPETKMATYFRSIGLPLEDKYLQTAADAGYCEFDEALAFCAATPPGRNRGEGPPGEFLIQSFYPTSLQYLQERSDFRRALLITSSTTAGPPKVDSDAKLAAIGTYASILSLPLQWGNEVFANATTRSRAAGIEVHSWVTDLDSDTYDLLVDLGVTNTFTNNAGFGVGVLSQIAGEREIMGSGRTEDKPHVAFIMMLPVFGVIVGILASNAAASRGGWRRVLGGKSVSYSDIDEQNNISVDVTMSREEL